MKYGLIGGKLSHSYSRIIHEKLASYTYELHPLKQEEFAEFMTKKDFLGINVTIPYKCDVIPYLDSLDESAAAIGAVNTIVNRGGKLKGFNTDLPGFIYMAEKNGVSMDGKKVVVLGNGGAAQAVKAAVTKMGASKMIVVGHRTLKEGVITYDECFEKHGDASIVINTSPVGMYPSCDESPVDLTNFPACEAVLDLIYNPLPTKLVAQAQKLGMTGVCGLEMLVAQAKYASDIFLDKKTDDSLIEPIYRELKESMC